MSEAFDPYAREAELRSAAASWDTSTVLEARDGDVPVIDLHDYFSKPGTQTLERVARRLRAACESVGFFTIVGHQVGREQIAALFTMTRRFHALPLARKQALAMDRPGWPVGGVGYLPVGHRKLPARDRGNRNEAFIVKRDHQLTLNHNQWPAEHSLPGFRQAVETYAAQLETLGRRLLPVFARALDMAPDFFDAAFAEPLFRLRLTHYPPPAEPHADEFGIAPHVDTTFCTILAQDRPGLCIFSTPRGQWIRAPLLPDAFIVNTGELLRTWSNDRFISVRHFANNDSGTESRYSIPFFLNANPDYRMTCIPSCCGPGNPPKYAPISYRQSQAVAQGE